MSYVAKFDKIPPWLCRCIARSGHGLKVITQREIEARSGLGRHTILRISRLKSWATIPLKTIEAFTAACGVDLLAPAEHLRFLKRRKRAYMERARPEQRKMLLRLMSANLDVTK